MSEIRKPQLTLIGMHSAHDHEPFPLLQPYDGGWVNTPSGQRERTEPQEHAPRAARTGLYSTPVHIPPARRRPKQAVAAQPTPVQEAPSPAMLRAAALLICWIITAGVAATLLF